MKTSHFCIDAIRRLIRKLFKISHALGHGVILLLFSAIVNLFLYLQTKKLQIYITQICPQNGHINATSLHLQDGGGARLVNATFMHLQEMRLYLGVHGSNVCLSY